MGLQEVPRVSLNKNKLHLVVNVIFAIHISGLLPNFCGASGNDSFTTPPFIDKELILTEKEKIAFDRFKNNVWGNITEEWKDYVKQDLFLLRWIRAKDLDANRATRDMFQFLDFLKKNDVYHLLQEDFSDIYADFPYHLDAVDRQGRPVGYGSVGDGWNVRRGILQGKRNRLMKYTYRIAFQALDVLVRLNKVNPNVTQFVIILNMDGFNVFQHSCSSCITLYLNLLDVYERYVPGYAREIIVINAPQAYLVLLEILRPALSSSTRKALKVFGTNKNKWKPYLEERIDLKKQLPWEFGGSKKETSTKSWKI